MPEISTSRSRFKLESHDHAGNYVATLPYRSLQGEWMLGAAGQQLRGDIPYRRYSQVTPANLYAGKHELWLFDKKVSLTDPIFAGPVWDITASSSSGVLSFAAQDPATYLSKRFLKTLKVYNDMQGADKIVDLIAYMNTQRATLIVTSKQTANAQISSTRYKSIERKQLKDLIDQIAQDDDGTEYYMRTVGGQHTLYIYGGLIKPTAKTIALEYGGALDGYSVQYNAQAIANDYEIISDNSRIGSAVDAAKKTEYNALYQQVDIGSSLTSTTALNTAVAKNIKDTKSTKVIPTITTRDMIPIKDFDFGTQFTVVINDWYVKLNQVIRVIGWQETISQGDETTINIFTKDNEGVT